MNVIDERLSKLRKVMKEHKIDAYYVPTDDFHMSEYVGDFFKCRRYITGFTGSAGCAVISQDAAGLWVDGRYFIQGEEQTKDSSVTLFKQGEPGVPEVHDYIRDLLKDGQSLGFDGRSVSAAEAAEFKEMLEKKHCTTVSNVDLVGKIWENRPALSGEPAWELETKWSGEKRKDKLARLRKKMEDAGADGMLIGTLDDIAWLLNIRGNDVPCNPVVLSYLFVGLEKATLFVRPGAFDQKLEESLKEDGVELADYDEIYEWLGKIEERNIWITEKQINARLVSSLPGEAARINKEDPILLMKAVKNPVEVSNMKMAHIRDGAAVTRFIFWLKQNVGKIKITEMSAAEKLYTFRAGQDNFVGNSFDPIIAYGEHAAICHYFATEETDYELKPQGMVLADTGGQYYEGTTDITRTIVLGPVTEEEKKFFTLVLKGHLRLMDAKFRSGCSGINLDYIAREPLWRIGKDFNHGTGHGVGYFLNVHEGPNGFRWKQMAGRKDSDAFEPGMITSDEPGYYAEGKFGIRHENLILCKNAGESDGMEFLEFEPLTMVPFDLEGIDPGLLGEEERKLLNSYHRTVYEKISPLLSEEECALLKDATRPI